MERHQFSSASIMDLPAFRVIGFEENCTGTAVVLQCSLETCVDTSAPSIANMYIFGYLFVSNERLARIFPMITFETLFLNQHFHLIAFVEKTCELEIREKHVLQK